MRTSRVITTHRDQESVASLPARSSEQPQQATEEEQEVAAVIRTFKEDMLRAKVLSALKATSSLTQECTDSQVIDVVQGQLRNLSYAIWALSRQGHSGFQIQVYSRMTLLVCQALSVLLLIKTNDPVFERGSSNLVLMPFSVGGCELVQLKRSDRKQRAVEMKHHSVPMWRAWLDEWPEAAVEDETVFDQMKRVVALVETLCGDQVEGPADGNNSTCSPSVESGTSDGSSQSSSTPTIRTAEAMPSTLTGSAGSRSASAGGTNNATTVSGSDQV
jgi:hypothetical protein